MRKPKNQAEVKKKLTKKQRKEQTMHLFYQDVGAGDVCQVRANHASFLSRCRGGGCLPGEIVFSAGDAFIL